MSSAVLQIVIVSEVQAAGATFNSLLRSALPADAAVVQVPTAAAALRLLDEGLPDLFLIEAALAGTEFAAQVRAIGCRAPIVALAPRAEAAKAKRLLETGVTDLWIHEDLNAAEIDRCLRYVQLGHRASSASDWEVAALKLAAENLVHLYQTLAANFPNGSVYLFDKDLRVLLADGRGIAAIGMERDQIIGKTLSEVFGNDADFVEMQEAHRHALEGEECFFEGQINGRFREVRAVPVRDEKGTITGVMAMTQDITERKHVELALRDSEARLRAFLDNTPALVFIHDEDGRYVYLNKAVQQFVKTPIADLLGKTVFDRMPADIAQPLRENFLKVIHGGTAQEFEETVPSPDGTLRHQIVVKFPMEESAGRKLLAGVAIDITERKQAEEKLRDSEARLSRAQEIAHLGYITKSPGADRLEWSDEVFRILGFEPQSFEPTRQSVMEAVHPDDATMLLVALTDLNENQKPIDLKHRIVRPDGSVRWVHVLMEPVWDNDGHVERYDGTFLDISDLIRFEEELRESEALKSAILESALDAIITMDSEGRILEFNPAAETTFGFKREDVIGQSLANTLIPPGFREMHIRAYENCLETGFGPNLDRRLEVTALRSNGEEFPVELAIHRISRGGQETFTGFVRDISERKRAEEDLRASQVQLQHAHDELERRVHERTQELEETNRALHTEITERQIAMGALREIVGQLEIAKEEAERANNAKSEFLSRMSHELRTPMNSIMGFAQIMEMTAPEGRQAHRINQILKAGQHLLHLINEVLDLSRVESGRLSLMPEPVSVGAAIETAVDLIRPLCQQRDVTVMHDSSKCEKVYVTADHQRLAQVLLNLLGNATKYNRHGGSIQIVCDSSKAGLIRLSVRDSGVGIAAADLPRLFIPFERLSVTAGTVEGTGLGLALSKRLVEAMGGSMGVESAVGLGSTFWLELPVAAAPTAISEDPIDEHALDFAGAPATILYIEDSATNYQVLEDLLSVHENLRLMGALDGRSGLDLANQVQPALILLDLHLPDIHGEEVLQRLKLNEMTKSVPVIVVSADATPTQIHRLLEGGAVEYLTKPLDMRRLLSVMAKVLSDK